MNLERILKDIGKIGAKVLLNKEEKSSDKIDINQINSTDILKIVLKRLYYQGDYNKAEDVIFEELQKNNSPQIYEIAVEFYNSLLEKSEEDLKKNNFSREEIYQGLEDIKRGISVKKEYFNDYDFTNFWKESDYALENYVEEEPSDELIKSIEEEVGYKLPESYIYLMKLHNGGIPTKTCYPTETSTSWAEDHIAISGIMGIGREKTYSLCGQLGSQFMIDEWEYPSIGVVICDCPSAGHDVIMLDYRKCGNDGEPEVVHVDQECDYEITFLAKDFETFITGLVDESNFDL